MFWVYFKLIYSFSYATYILSRLNYVWLPSKSILYIKVDETRYTTSYFIVRQPITALNGRVMAGLWSAVTAVSRTSPLAIISTSLTQQLAIMTTRLRLAIIHMCTRNLMLAITLQFCGQCSGALHWGSVPYGFELMAIAL